MRPFFFLFRYVAIGVFSWQSRKGKNPDNIWLEIMPEIKSWIKNIAPNAQDSDCVTTNTASSEFTPTNGATISSTTTSFFPRSCQNNDHCEPGTTCLKTNTCGLCKTKKDCKEHEICLSSISGPGAAKNGKCDLCREDEDCEPWESCLTGKKCGTCSKNGECEGNKICLENGKCVECKEDSDCPSGKTCLANNICGNCIDNGHCEGSRVCLDSGKCGECKKDSDCGVGKSCLASNVCGTKTSTKTSTACCGKGPVFHFNFYRNLDCETVKGVTTVQLNYKTC